MTVVVLGGTAEALELANRLSARAVSVVTSLAGASAAPRVPAGEVRFGGFGGVDGLVAYLRQGSVAAVVDATHPFAHRITANAVAASRIADVPLLRLQRPSWSQRPDAASWRWVDAMLAARTVALQLGHRAFLAVGRSSLGDFSDWLDRFVLVRVVAAPDRLPPRWQVVVARGPFTVDDELALMRQHAIDVLVTKDSGGPADAKLTAAALLGVPVVCVRRPPLPEGIPVVSTVEQSLDWLGER